MNIWISATGVLIFLVNYFFLGLPILSIVSAAVIFMPLFFSEYRKFKEIRECEAKLPIFFKNLSESVNAGMPLPKAVEAAYDNEYGALNPYVEKMAAQVSWGMPLDKALIHFGNSIKSRIIKRSIATVIDVENSGGNIKDMLDSLSDSISEIQKIQKERAAGIYGQLIEGYIMFFVFIGVMIGMQLYLLPSFTELSETTVIGMDFNLVFKAMILIQAFFAGLIIGKMSEGSAVAGLKHSFFLIFAGYGSYILMVG